MATGDKLLPKQRITGVEKMVTPSHHKDTADTPMEKTGQQEKFILIMILYDAQVTKLKSPNIQGELLIFFELLTFMLRLNEAWTALQEYK